MQHSNMASNKRIWQPSEKLLPRIKRLREEYFSFNERSFRNEATGFSDGKPWDIVWGPHNWTIVPELIPFLKACGDSLVAAAIQVPLEEDAYKKPLVIRRAKFFKDVISKHIPVDILEGELIVGAFHNTSLSRTLTRKEAAQYEKLEQEFLNEAIKLNELGVGNCGAVPGHLIPNYKKVLHLGFAGLLEEINATRNGNNDHGEHVRQAMVICCAAVSEFTRRYADEADRLAVTENDVKRKAELEQIAANCRRVPYMPPITFHEAVQALWFTHMLVMAQEGYPGPGLSFGRIDQYLYPYYKTDIDEGRITHEFAKEILECFWVKCNYAYDHQGRIGPNQGINSGFGQLITLSGLDMNGEDATNDLTWLMLEVIEDMNLLEPKPNVRLHRNTPDDLLRRVAELVSRSQGAPFLLNFDENSIEGLRWQGLPEDELWDYAPVGCLENTLQGCDRSGTVDVNLNLAKAVELVMNNGHDEKTGECIGVSTGDPLQFKSFSDFRRAVYRQLDALIDRIIRATNKADAIRARFEPTPYLSTLIDGCAEQGLDITEGGARYNFLTVEGIGLATLVDSMLAVKKLVFDERRISMATLERALKDNFEGHDKIQALLLNKAPKFGNDDPRADQIAREVSQHWTRRVYEYTTPTTGKRYRGGYLSWNYWISYAPSTAATPDGRPRGKFLSNGVCPVNGADANGPTAVIHSVGKLGLETAPNGGSHTISLSPSLLRDEEHLQKLMGLLRGYAEEGGTALQINVTDPALLREAQKNPSEYRNLLVRVTGYNAYFVMLGKEVQEELINRESHAM